MANDNNCASCGRDVYVVGFGMGVINSDGNDYKRFCKECRHGKASVPDVWYGYGSGTHTEENIADPKTGEPIPFYDKQSKAAAMKMAGVREAGDRVHGCRIDDMTPQKRKTYI